MCSKVWRERRGPGQPRLTTARSDSPPVRAVRTHSCVRSRPTHPEAGAVAAARHKGENVTHVDERANRSSGSGQSTGQSTGQSASQGNQGRLPQQQPWTAGNGRTRRRTVTYADAGVSIHAGEKAVELLRTKVYRTHRPEVMGDLGGFAGLFRLDVKKYRNPILASSTDGVGTKLAIAQAMDIHDTVGIDLVAMVVDDLVACGAEPLFLLDYIACGEVVPDRVAEIGAGIADGCRYAGCALLGGETAEHPGVMRPDEYDISGTGVG